MSMFGHREMGDQMTQGDISMMSGNYQGESTCHRFWQRLMTCVRESQEMDVLYDCRSRMLDMRECAFKHKQSTWVMRETMATLRNEAQLRAWLRDYDEQMGHAPLLEAVQTVRKKVEAEGGIDILNPTVFKDPDVFIPRQV